MATPQLSDWQGSLDDSTPLADVSIPGTHNSAAFAHHAALCPLWPWAQCQSASLAEQLAMGIRCFDIRIGLPVDDVRLSHTALTSETLRSALATVARHLEEHPSEFVILRIKKDHYFRHLWDSAGIALVRALIDDSPLRLAPPPNAVTSSPAGIAAAAAETTVGELRGTVLLTSRMPKLLSPATSWPFGALFCPERYTECWDCGNRARARALLSEHVSRRAAANANAATATATAAVGGAVGGAVAVTTVAVSNGGGAPPPVPSVWSMDVNVLCARGLEPPARCAAPMNAWLGAQLEGPWRALLHGPPSEQALRKALGIVTLDFADPAIVEQLVRLNFTEGRQL